LQDSNKLITRENIAEFKHLVNSGLDKLVNSLDLDSAEEEFQAGIKIPKVNRCYSYLGLSLMRCI
jgi:hypothetical protein